jgi:hypothetical protein
MHYDDTGLHGQMRGPGGNMRLLSKALPRNPLRHIHSNAGGNLKEYKRSNFRRSSLIQGTCITKFF